MIWVRKWCRVDETSIFNTKDIRPVDINAMGDKPLRQLDTRLILVEVILDILRISYPVSEKETCHDNVEER